MSLKRILNLSIIVLLLVSCSSTQNNKVNYPYSPITIEDDKEDNNFNYIDVPDENTSTTLSYENVDEINNSNSIRKVNKKENKFTIIEWTLQEKNKERATKLLPGITVNIGTPDPDAPIHGETVLKSFLDLNNDYSLSSQEISGVVPSDITLISKSYARTHTPASLTGIVNMSYGLSANNEYMQELYDSNLFLDKRSKFIFNYYNDFMHFTSALDYKNYVHNNVLKVVSMGNGNDATVKDETFSQFALNYFAKSSKDMQELIRSETIIVKDAVTEKTINKYGIAVANAYGVNTYFPPKNLAYTDIYGNKYYEPPFFTTRSTKYSDAIPLLLRGMTVAMDGIMLQDNDNGYKSFSYGSSFSAPKVSRVAYELKKKFPSLSYQQIKQIILTTARRDSSGYLSDIVGWGYVDLEKALNGPSDFNAGLIEEEKFFLGNFEKIFDQYGNRYFYVNTDENESYIFSNDITSGLPGDGNSDEYYISEFNGLYDRPIATSEEEKAKIKGLKFRLRIPKVLESEKLFYSNVATAGLRKDGLGTLTLTGNQLYSNKTQVLQGTLILKNHSASPYEVFKDATLVLENTNKKLRLSNIDSSGTVKFLTSVTMKNYTADNNSTTYIGNNVKIQANEFKTNGQIAITTNSPDIDSVIVVKNEKDLKDISLSNLYVKPLVIRDNILYNIKFVSALTNDYYYGYIYDFREFRKLKELSSEELKDIPSYDINESKFFDEYIDKESGVMLMNMRVKRYLDNNNTYVNLLNLHAVNRTKEELKQEVFTDIYTSFVNNIFESYNIRFNNDKTYLNRDDNTNNILFNTYVNTNVYKGENYTSFKKINNLNTLAYSVKIDDNNLILKGTYGLQYYHFKNDDLFVNNIYSLGIGFATKNFINTNYEFTTSYNDSNVTRNINDEKVKNNIKSLVLNLNFDINKDFNIDILKTKFNVSLGNNFTFLNLFETEKEDSIYGIKVYNNILLKDDINVSIATSTKLNERFSIENTLTTMFNVFNNKNELDVNLLDVDTTLKGKDIEKYIINYSIGANMQISDRIKMYLNTNIDSNLKVGLGATLNVLLK